jgi:hypothetical protein
MEINYNNLFLNAMDTDQQMSIQEIKANKQFALQLINDLDRVFQTNYQVEDQENGVVIRIKTSPSNNWYHCFSFVVGKGGITFNCQNLGYYHTTQFKSLGPLYEKYKGNGATADDNMLREGTQRHGWVKFSLKINRNGDNLNDTLKDIIYLMEQNQYKKRF